MRNSKTNWKVEMWEILTGKLCSRKPTFQNEVCGNSVELLPNTQLLFFFSTLLTKMTYCHNLENNSVRLCTGLKKIDIIKRIYSYNYSVSMDRTFNLHLYYKSPLYIKTSYTPCEPGSPNLTTSNWLSFLFKSIMPWYI